MSGGGSAARRHDAIGTNDRDARRDVLRNDSVRTDDRTLPDPDVAPAIANIAAMSRGLVYFEITTRFDLKERCDTERTDLDIFVRNGSYYRTILQKHFVQVGGGLWWTKEITPPFFELEMAGSAK